MAQRDSKLGEFARITLAAFTATMVFASIAQGHRLAAQAGGVTCFGGIPCDADHIEGTYQVGVPGVNPNYVTLETGANSASGHLFSYSSFSWLEQPEPSGPKIITEVIEENAILQRIAPGPVTIRASLDLAGSGHVVGNGSIKLNATIQFGGCQIYAEKVITSTISTDLVPTPSGAANCTLEESRISSFATYGAEQNLPTNPLLRVQLQALYSSLFLGSVADFGWEGDLHVELTNATAEWDTASFLTQAPEPGADALGASALGALAVRRRLRRSSV